ncbi:MAG: hypothetical protein NVS1B10_02020 [Candidatus Saccharimonadales bacterium]
MRLSNGQKAPAFKVKDIYGTDVLLTDYKNKKLLICFFRYAGCPFCNLVMHGIIDHYSWLNNQGLEVLAFIQSPAEAILEYPQNQVAPKAPFPLIADPKRQIYNKYGVETSLAGSLKSLAKSPLELRALTKKKLPQGKIDGNILLMPAFFLVNKDQILYRTFYGANFGDSIPFVEIVDFLTFA